MRTLAPAALGKGPRQSPTKLAAQLAQCCAKVQLSAQFSFSRHPTGHCLPLHTPTCTVPHLPEKKDQRQQRTLLQTFQSNAGKPPPLQSPHHKCAHCFQPGHGISGCPHVEAHRHPMALLRHATVEPAAPPPTAEPPVVPTPLPADATLALLVPAASIDEQPLDTSEPSHTPDALSQSRTSSALSCELSVAERSCPAPRPWLS